MRDQSAEEAAEGRILPKPAPQGGMAKKHTAKKDAARRTGEKGLSKGSLEKKTGKMLQQIEAQLGSLKVVNKVQDPFDEAQIEKQLQSIMTSVKETDEAKQNRRN